MKKLLSIAATLCVTTSLTACDGQQYVSPDTVRLLITDDSTRVDRVDRCNYLPVLLGGEVKSRYAVDGDVKATLTLTRDAVSVVFEGAPEAETFAVDASALRESAQTAASPPAGYTVELSTGCTPDGG